MALTFSEAREKLQDPYSCFKLVRHSKHLTLCPKYIGSIKSGIRAQLDSELQLFSEHLNGVLIAYDNIVSLTPNGAIMDEQPYIHISIQADFIIFQPTVGSMLKGVVNKKSTDHIGCLVHGCFNAAMSRRRHEGAAWVGSTLSLGDEILFEVISLESNNGVVSIKGRITSSSIDLTQDNINARGQKRSRQFSIGSDTPAEDAVDAQDGSTKGKPKTKRRRVEDVSTSSSSMINPSSPTFNELPSLDSSKTASHKKKKIKKEKESPSTSVNDTTFNSSSTNPHDPLAQRLGFDDLDSTLPESHHKKKKKKDKRKRNESLSESAQDESVLNNNNVVVKQENSVALSDLDSGIQSPVADSDSSAARKKKKKKSKHKDRLDASNASLEQSAQDTLLSVKLEDSVTKSKKKKKKDKVKIKEEILSS